MKTIASLDSAALARRLHDLVGQERNVQVDFLLHLEEFDRRRAYLEEGYGSLWEYCQQALHLREGAAWRRIAAMKVLRKLPRMEAALRDGRLCLATLALLAPVLTADNADELLGRAAYRSKAEVDSLVASLKPRPAPADGLRKLPEPREAPSESAAAPAAAPLGAAPPSLFAAAVAAAPCGARDPVSPETGAVERAEPPPVASLPRRDVHMQAVAQDRWSLRVTIDRDLKNDLETLGALLSHKVPSGDLAAVLHEAVRCGIEKHGKRKGAVAPARRRSPSPAARKSQDPRVIPMEVRRQVWRRDGGRCTWTSPEGKRCGSRWQLELDHVTPPLFGGGATVDNLRLRCKPPGVSPQFAEEPRGRTIAWRRGRAESGSAHSPLIPCLCQETEEEAHARDADHTATIRS